MIMTGPKPSPLVKRPKKPEQSTLPLLQTPSQPLAAFAIFPEDPPAHTKMPVGFIHAREEQNRDLPLRRVSQA